MGKISKALAGGLGAAIAKTILIFLPMDMDEETKQAIEYAVYTLLTGLAVYIAPKNDTL